MTRAVRSSLLSLFLLGAASSCRHGVHAESGRTCDIAGDSDASSLFSSPAAPADLSAVKPFHSYLAVTNVGPVAHHFQVWFRQVEPVTMRIRALRDESGKLHLIEESGYWGGMGVPPDAPPQPPPPEVAELAKAVETELGARCKSATGFRVEHLGFYRTVDAVEFIAHDLRTGPSRWGWKASATLIADPRLTTLNGSAERLSGWSLLELPQEAQWIPAPLPPAQDGQRLALAEDAPTPPLATRILEAARQLEAHAPSPRLADLVPADAPLLPASYVPLVVAKVAFSGRPNAGGRSNTTEARIPLDLRDAVFGAQATGEVEVPLCKRRIKVRATLTSAAPRTLAPALTTERFAGTLTLNIQDDRGQLWGRLYPAKGELYLQGNQVVAPSGLELPGSSSPSKEHDALLGQFSGDADCQRYDFKVDVSVFNDPRK